MKKIYLSLISFICIVNPSISQKSWNQLADFSSGARNNAIGFAINGKGYIGLGQNSTGTRYYDFYEYDPSGNTWTKKTDYPGGGSAAATSFAINGKGYVCFGVGSSSTIHKDLWEYSPSTNTWTQKATFPGSARYSTASFVINDTAYLIGGNTGGSPYSSEVWMYVPATNTWSQKANFTGGARSAGAGFTINGVGYFGTGITSSTSAKKDMWKYDKSKDTWSGILDVPFAAITSAIGFEIDNRGFLGTGFNLSNYSKDIYEYDPALNKWTKLDTIPSSQSVRGASVSFVINRTAYLGTGYGTSSSISLKDFWSFKPKSKCSAGISTQPKNQSVNLNDTAKFSALSIDNSANYKWQINTGSGFSNISNGGQYSGANTNKLTILNVKFSTNNNNKFRCIATNSDCSDTSITVTLTVICSSIIKNEPSNINSSNGSDVKFYISTAFNPILQWQLDGGTGFSNLSNIGQYSGSDKDTLKVSGLTLANNNFKFRCLASYAGCVDTSLSAILSVYCKPIIKGQPTGKTLYKGENAKITVSYYDNGTNIKWQLKIGTTFQDLSDAGQFSGTATDTLFINLVNVANNKQEYRSILNYKGCADTSQLAMLKVLCNPIVNTQPVNQTKTEGENTTFSVSSFDSKATYIWQGNIGIGFQNLNNAGQFSNVFTETVSISNLSLSNDKTKFRCILASEGCFDTSKEATLRVVCKAILATQPISKTAYIGDNTFFSFTSVESKATLIWQSNIGFGFQTLSNAGQFKGVDNDTLSISNLTFANDNQIFRCILNFGGCYDTTDNVNLQVICKDLIQVQPKNQTGYISGNTYLHVVPANSGANFRWQSDIGFGFQNLSNAGQFKGVNNDTLTISNLTIANNDQTFRCIISDGICSDTSKITTLTVSAGVQNKYHLVNFRIYPNPTKDYIYVETGNEEMLNDLLIYNLDGKLLLQMSIESNKMAVNIKNLSNGIYYLKLISDQGVEIKKIIKQ